MHTCGGCREIVRESVVRVALVIGQLSHGGAERQLFELARRLPARGYDPLVISISPVIEPYGPALRRCGVEVRFLPRKRNFEFTRAVRLARLFKMHRVDLVHAFLLTANAYAWVAVKLARVPAFLPSVRSKETARPIGPHLIDRYVLKHSPIVLVNSNHLVEWTQRRYGLPAERVKSVPNGLAMTRFESVERLPVQRNRPAKVGTICLFKPVKRIDFMLKVARGVARQRPGTTMVIAGDGPERAAMLRLRAELGLEGIVAMPGAVPDSAPVLSELDIFILTSEHEGMPNVVLEAMAAGRPVVGTNIPGIADVVQEGKTGHLVAVDDLDGFVAALVGLIDEPGRAQHLGEAARKRAVECFSASRMVDGTVALYEQLLTTKREPDLA